MFFFCSLPVPIPHPDVYQKRVVLLLFFFFCKSIHTLCGSFVSEFIHIGMDSCRLCICIALWNSMVLIHHYTHDGYLGICQFVAITKTAIINILVFRLCTYVCIFMGLYLGVELLEYETFYWISPDFSEVVQKRCY